MVLHHMLFLFLSREILVTLAWTHSLILITWQRLGPQGMSIDWQAAPASPSSHIVKKILRLDIPVDSYPNVSKAFTLKCIMLISTRIVQTVKGYNVLNAWFPCGLQFNFVGRLLGPRGNSLKQVEASMGCRVYIRGKGSIKDPEKVPFFPLQNKVQLGIGLFNSLGGFQIFL